MTSLYIGLITFLHFLAGVPPVSEVDAEMKGIYNATVYGISGNGKDMSEKINHAFSLPQVKELVFDRQGETIVVNNLVNIPAGKIIRFYNQTKISGTGVLKGGSVAADKNAWIFDRQLTVLLDDTSQFSVKWYGAKGDGITDDSEPIRTTFEMARQKKGGNILFPAGTYIVSRQANPPYRIIGVFSGTKVRGEGMYTTSVKLSPADIGNFRRVFSLGDRNGDVENVEISHLGIDMSNTFMSYPPPPSFGKDAQSAGIFCYSDPYVVRNAYFHDLFIHDVTGDALGVSKNSRNITVERIYQRDYLRQGIAIGGNGGVDSITVKHIYDLPFESGMVRGGSSVHVEPAATVKNISFQNCRIMNLSAGGINGLWIDSVTTTVDLGNACNNVQNFLITRSVLNGRLQVSPKGPGTIKGNVFNKGLYFVSVGKGGFRPMKDIYVINNTVKDTIGKANLKIGQVGGVNVINNTVESNINGIEFANAGYGKIIGNKIKLRTKGSSGVYVYCTIAPRYGEGLYAIDSNVVSDADKAIKIGRVSCVLGNNNITVSGKRIVADDSVAKLFPDEEKRKNMLWLSKMPQWGVWRKGDIINITTAAEQYEMICKKDGALHAGNWNAAGSYQLNDFAKAANNDIYKAVAASGQVQDPVTDNGKYWIKVTSEEARFERK